MSRSDLNHLMVKGSELIVFLHPFPMQNPTAVVTEVSLLAAVLTSVAIRAIR